MRPLWKIKPQKRILQIQKPEEYPVQKQSKQGRKSNVYLDDIYLYSFRSTFRANLIDCYLKGTCLHLCTFIKIENILYKENYTKSINKIKWAVNIGTYLWTQPHSSINLYICSVCWRHIVFCLSHMNQYLHNISTPDCTASDLHSLVYFQQ